MDNFSKAERSEAVNMFLGIMIALEQTRLVANEEDFFEIKRNALRSFTSQTGWTEQELSSSYID